MKSIVLFVLALIAVVIADDADNLEIIAKKFDVDVPILQACLDEAGLNMAEMLSLLQKLGEIEDVTEEVKQSFTKYNNFLVCTFEKNGMMIDTKLVVDKIVKQLEREEKFSKKIATECINSLNDNSQMTKEDRVFGLMLCVITDEDRK